MSQVKSLRTGIKFKDTPIGKIPVDWEAVDLVGVSDRSIKYSFIDGDWIETPYLSDKGIRLIQTGNIGDGKFVDKNKKYISEETFKKLKCKEVSQGDILICRMAAPIGRACIAPDLGMKMITAVDCTIIKVDKKSFDTSFLNYMINSPLVRNQAEMLSGGSTRQRVSRRNLETIKIISPPLSEQKKIAEILTTVNDAIEETGRIIEKTKELKKGLMQQLLTRGIGHKKFKKTEIGEIPVEWEVVRLNKVVKEFYNGGTPDTKVREYWDGDIPWVTGADFISQRISQIRRYITMEGVKNSATNLIPKGNLLVVTRTGVGKLAIAPFDIAISQDITGVITDAKRLMPDFLYRFLDYHEKKLKSLVQGTSINGLLREDLASLSICLPTLKEQKEITDILTTSDLEIDNEEANKQNLETLKKSLMQVLLTGRVRVKLR